MERASLGDRWAYGRPRQPFVTAGKKRWSGTAALVSIFVMLAALPALADGIEGDADALATAAPAANGLTADQTIGGSAVLYDYSAVVKETGNATNDVFTTTGDTVSATVTVTQDFTWPVSVDTQFTGTNAFTAYDQNRAGKLSVTVPNTATDGQVNHINVTITALASNGRSMSPDKVQLNYNITAKAPVAPANTPPNVDAGGPYSGSEGANISISGTATDNEDTLTTAWAYTAGAGVDAGATCSFANAAAQSTTVKCTDDGTYTLTLTATGDPDGAVSDTATLTLTNADPSVVASFGGAVDCRTVATLTIDPDDLGTNDSPWKVNINWGDATTQPEITRTDLDQFTVTHVYTLAGPYNATVTVEDDDAGTGSDLTNPITVNQTYAIDFLPPFDDSTPSGLIVNKMKNGRVVPVKATLFDECSLSSVTDPTTAVTIKISKTSGSGTGDPVEQYADAGESSSGTNAFRWSTDGFWIYNLDSKALGLVVNNLYRIDVYVGTVQATADNWGVLQPVK